jgi:hypothetical protein
LIQSLPPWLFEGTVNQTIPVFHERFQRALKITIERSPLFEFFDEFSEGALVAAEDVRRDFSAFSVEHDPFAETDNLLGVLKDKHQLSD